MSLPTLVDTASPSIITEMQAKKEQMEVMMNTLKGRVSSDLDDLVNLDKIQAIMEMAPPRNVKEVQSLNGKIAALNRFVSRATDKCLPFFRTLKKSFEWTAKCQRAFEELKAYLSSPLLLNPSQPGEDLFLYLAVSPLPSVPP